MAAHAQIEAAKTITRQTVTTALEDNSLRLEVFHDGADDGLEDGAVGIVVDSIAKGEVDGIILARSDTNVAQLAGTGEVLAVLVEGYGHDAIGCVESFFDTIAVVNIDINVENALLEPQELEDSQDDICSKNNR